MKHFLRSIALTRSGQLCIVTICVYIYLTFVYNNGNVLSWDVFGYYLYLPETFIYNDPGIHDLSNIDHILSTYHNTPTFYQAHPHENGNHILQYPVGMAILFSPFFFVGHACAYIFGYPTDGFSEPYQFTFLLGYIFYTILAIFLIRKLLLIYFSETITCIALLILLFGTNFYQVSIGAAGMPHIYLFVLFAVVLLLTHRWHLHHKKSTAFWLGMTIGLMTVSRPTEILIAIIPILYGVISFKSIFERIRTFLTIHKQHLMLAGLGFIIVLFPQLLYWKMYTGEFLYYSYKNPNEGFDFLSPHTWNFLLSFRKGWFIYTPIMLFAFFGFYHLCKNKSPWFLPALIFVVLNVYVLSAWSCWWYAGSFSQRPVVQSYPIMCILIGSLVYGIYQAGKLIKIVSSVVVVFFIALNLFQTWQIHNGIIDPYRMTWKYYAAVFGKTEIPDGATKLLLIDRSATGEQPFMDSTGYVGSNVILPGKEACADSESPFSSTWEIPYNKITQKDHAWLVISCDLICHENVSDLKPSIIQTFKDYKGRDFAYRGYDFEKEYATLPARSVIKYSYTYLTPEMRNTDDKFTIFLWIRGKGKACIRNLQVRAYEETE